jgi:uncharacterized protein YecE (DUF72 family)
MSDNRQIFIGTSGWHYKHWKGPFYPSDMNTKDFLPYYADRFETTEINNTFYSLPQEKTLKQWQSRVQKDFVFSVKASRYITHMKKLKDPEAGLSRFLPIVKALDKNPGPVLFQLPPKWNCNADRLKRFLEVLDGHEHQWVFELRDRSWFNDEVLKLLSDHGAALCIYDMEQEVSPKEITTDFTYIRLHGPGAKYQGDYDTQALAGWAGAFSSWAAKGIRVYCYFDNDEQGFAARDALRLKNMLDGSGT